MALSNWDTLALGLDGAPCHGTVVSPLGVSVRFHKNWLYVLDPTGWQAGGRFVEPTVMSIEDGTLHYKDVAIYAERGPQEGVYAAVSTGPLGRAVLGMVGCSVYGFDKAGAWTGITADSIAWFSRRIRGTRDHWPESFDPDWLGRARSLNQGDAYIAHRAGMSDFSIFVALATAPGARNAPLIFSLLPATNEEE